MTRTSVHADLANNRKDDVLGAHTLTKPPGDVDRQGARPALQQTLAGQHMPHLGRSDAECQRAKGAMSAGMAVAAHDRLARLGGPQLGADDVNDTAMLAPEAVQMNAEFVAVIDHGFDLPGGGGLTDHVDILERGYGLGGGGVIHGGYGAVRPAHGQARGPQRRVSLGCGDLVDQVQVDVQHRGCVFGFWHHHMLVPNLLEQ